MRKKGYTLVEVLIASLIFSAMVVLASFAFNQGMRQYEAVARRGINFWENTKILLLERSISSMLDYYVVDEKNFWFPYFTGRSDLISYVSISPFSHDLPVVVFLEKKKDPSGKFSLVYYEIPVYTKGAEELERIKIFKDYEKGISFVILSEADEINFSFYVYDRLRNIWDWVSEYEGKKAPYLPQMLKISYFKDEEKDSFYFGIYTDSVRKIIYNERYIRP